MGYRATAVAPVLVDLATFDRKVDRRAYEALIAGKRGAEWLFVGRLAPNKAQHDVLRAFALYRRCYDPDATLSLVGGASSVRYERALLETVESLGLGGAVRMPGSVLRRCARGALSRRRRVRLPVRPRRVLRAAARGDASPGADRRLCGGGGAGDARRRRVSACPDKAPAAVAQAVSVVMDDAVLRAQLARASEARLLDFDLVHTSATFIAAVGSAIGVAA